jgi:penicillin-binding protein-related factor A (putative recombinase)
MTMRRGRYLQGNIIQHHMQKREAHLTTKIKKWLQTSQTGITGTCAFEMKVTTGRSIPFSAVQPHQIDALRFSSDGRFLWKISDDSIGFKPFDMFMLENAKSYVVVGFITLGKKSSVWFVPVSDWVYLEHCSERKSVTEEMLSGLSPLPFHIDL